MAALLSEIPKPAPAKSVVNAFLRDSPTEPLTFQDRCDCSALEGDKAGHGYLGSCGAQAQVRVTMRTGPQIVFCGHHYAQHGPRITQVSVVYDERAEVVVTFTSPSVTPAEHAGLREVSP
jgi:hypothetical protein